MARIGRVLLALLAVLVVANCNGGETTGQTLMRRLAATHPVG